MLKLDLTDLPPHLRLGTSSFSSTDWRGTFYPEGAPPADFLSHYAETFSTVEVDATWHHLPSRRTVESWARKVPEGFVFSLKVPKTITHERYLQDCREEWKRFLDVLEPLGERRGPLLFQFPYVAKGKDADEYETGDDFRRRLAAFLPELPRDGQYVVEVRNAKWLAEPLLDLLRARGIALGLAAYYTLPRPADLARRIDPVTAPFSYLRFLGDHRRMDRMVREARERGERDRDWGALLVDRTAETRDWVAFARPLVDRQINLYTYFNNHFAGFAPGSVEVFARAWRDS